MGLRPESITLEPSAHGPAEVVSREFRGRDVLYGVTDPKLGTLRIQRPSFELIDVGSRVQLAPADGARAIPLGD